MHSCKSFSSPYVLCSVLAESLQVCGIALTNGLIKISLKLGGALSLIQQQSPKVLGLLGGRQHEIWGVWTGNDEEGMKSRTLFFSLGVFQEKSAYCQESPNSV